MKLISKIKFALLMIVLSPVLIAAFIFGVLDEPPSEDYFNE